MKQKSSNIAMLEKLAIKLNHHDLDLTTNKQENGAKHYKIVSLRKNPHFGFGFDNSPNPVIATTPREAIMMVQGFLLAKGYCWNHLTNDFYPDWPVNDVLVWGHDREFLRIWTMFEETRTIRRNIAMQKAQEDGIEFICPEHLTPALPGQKKSLQPSYT